MKQRCDRPRPTVGARNIKTALSASLCALLYFLIDRNPTFACIGAIFGMGANMEHSKLHGGNRLFGTVIGGFLGMGLFRLYLLIYPDGGHRLLLVPLLFLGVIVLIVLAQCFWIGAVQPGGVVLCIVLFNTPVDSYVTPVPWAMPGYESEVVMAAGAFVQGSSIELSADGPIRPPYAVYFQGGLTWYHAKTGILMSLQKMVDAGLVTLK